MADPTWSQTIDFLRGLKNVPAALANADLLESAQATWERVVVAQSSMHDILFTMPGDRYPFRAEVRVSWQEGVYEVRLLRTDLLITADRCLAPKSRLVLDAFLAQLAGGSSPI
jgi:hypothetical protein